VGRIRAWRINWNTSTVTEIKYIASVSVASHIHSPRNYDNWVWLFGYWGSNNNIERSTNEGISWVDAGDFGINYVNALNSNYMNYTDVVMAINKTIYEGTLGLATWTVLGTITSAYDLICMISRKPTDLDYIIAGIKGGSIPLPSKIWLTKDKGQTWINKSGNIPYDCGAIRAIVGLWDEDTVTYGPE